MFDRPRRRDSLPPTYESSVPEKPSFITRHFYRPTAIAPLDDTKNTSTGRRFSFLSSGCLILSIAMFLIVTAITCAVLATVMKQRNDAAFESGDNYFPTGPSPLHQAITANFPDPAIIQHNGTWYAFATNNAAGILNQPPHHRIPHYGESNIQLATSPDFKTWTLANYTQDPLPVLGAWADESDNSTGRPTANVWAPDILRRPSDGKWILYYSAAARGAARRTHCIGAAISSTITGPYVPLNTTLACPIAHGGAIDPAPVVDSTGAIWVAYKLDGNNAGHGGDCGNSVKPLVGTPIKLQRMRPDGVTPANSGPIEILDRVEGDGPLVEAPALVRSEEGWWFLFFSSGCTRKPSYDLKYAVARDITGPYVRAKRRLLKTGDWGLRAPGSVSVRRAEDSVGDGGKWRLAVHARVKTEWGDVRAMFTAGVRFNGTEVGLEGLE